MNNESQNKFANDEIGRLAFKPSRNWILSLNVGSLAPDCFNRLREVKEISFRGEDSQGKAFVGVLLAWGTNSTMSNSYKEGELVRGLGLSSILCSAECDALEAKLPLMNSLPCNI